uniref:CASPASE_P20 domain-containing protein n=1 Tax=Macrostomum lignano TaxID=282301 RepID=A0A1I8HMF7_9PLAT
RLFAARLLAAASASSDCRSTVSFTARLFCCASLGTSVSLPRVVSSSDCQFASLDCESAFSNSQSASSDCQVCVVGLRVCVFGLQHVSLQRVSLLRVSWQRVCVFGLPVCVVGLRVCVFGLQRVSWQRAYVFGLPVCVVGLRRVSLLRFSWQRVCVFGLQDVSLLRASLCCAFSCQRVSLPRVFVFGLPVYVFGLPVCVFGLRVCVFGLQDVPLPRVSLLLVSWQRVCVFGLPVCVFGLQRVSSLRVSWQRVCVFGLRVCVFGLQDVPLPRVSLLLVSWQRVCVFGLPVCVFGLQRVSSLRVSWQRVSLQRVCVFGLPVCVFELPVCVFGLRVCVYGLPRVSWQRVSLQRVSLQRVSLPRVSLLRVSLQRAYVFELPVCVVGLRVCVFGLQHVSLQRVSLQRVSWQRVSLQRAYVVGLLVCVVELLVCVYGLPRVSWQRVSLQRVSWQRVSLPRVSLLRVSLQRAYVFGLPVCVVGLRVCVFGLQHVSLQRVSLLRVSWQRVCVFGLPVCVVGLRVCVFGLQRVSWQRAYVFGLPVCVVGLRRVSLLRFSWQRVCVFGLQDVSLLRVSLLRVSWQRVSLLRVSLQRAYVFGLPVCVVGLRVCVFGLQHVSLQRVSLLRVSWQRVCVFGLPVCVVGLRVCVFGLQRVSWQRAYVFGLPVCVVGLRRVSLLRVSWQRVCVFGLQDVSLLRVSLLRVSWQRVSLPRVFVFGLPVCVVGLRPVCVFGLPVCVVGLRVCVFGLQHVSLQRVSLLRVSWQRVCVFGLPVCVVGLRVCVFGLQRVSWQRAYVFGLPVCVVGLRRVSLLRFSWQRVCVFGLQDVSLLRVSLLRVSWQRVSLPRVFVFGLPVYVFGLPVCVFGLRVCVFGLQDVPLPRVSLLLVSWQRVCVFGLPVCVFGLQRVSSLRVSWQRVCVFGLRVCVFGLQDVPLPRVSLLLVSWQRVCVFGLPVCVFGLQRVSSLRVFWQRVCVFGLRVCVFGLQDVPLPRVSLLLVSWQRVCVFGLPVCVFGLQRVSSLRVSWQRVCVFGLRVCVFGLQDVPLPRVSLLLVSWQRVCVFGLPVCVFGLQRVSSLRVSWQRVCVFGLRVCVFGLQDVPLPRVSLLLVSWQRVCVFGLPVCVFGLQRVSSLRVSWQRVCVFGLQRVSSLRVSWQRVCVFGLQRVSSLRVSSQRVCVFGLPVCVVGLQRVSLPRVCVFGLQRVSWQRAYVVGLRVCVFGSPVYVFGLLRVSLPRVYVFGYPVCVFGLQRVSLLLVCVVGLRAPSFQSRRNPNQPSSQAFGVQLQLPGEASGPSSLNNASFVPCSGQVELGSETLYLSQVLLAKACDSAAVSGVHGGANRFQLGVSAGARITKHGIAGLQFARLFAVTGGSYLDNRISSLALDGADLRMRTAGGVLSTVEDAEQLNNVASWAGDALDVILASSSLGDNLGLQSDLLRSELGHKLALARAVPSPDSLESVSNLSGSLHASVADLQVLEGAGAGVAEDRISGGHLTGLAASAAGLGDGQRFLSCTVRAGGQAASGAELGGLAAIHRLLDAHGVALGTGEGSDAVLAVMQHAKKLTFLLLLADRLSGLSEGSARISNASLQLLLGQLKLLDQQLGLGLAAAACRCEAAVLKGVAHYELTWRSHWPANDLHLAQGQNGAASVDDAHHAAVHVAGELLDVERLGGFVHRADPTVNLDGETVQPFGAAVATVEDADCLHPGDILEGGLPPGPRLLLGVGARIAAVVPRRISVQSAAALTVEGDGALSAVERLEYATFCFTLYLSRATSLATRQQLRVQFCGQADSMLAFEFADEIVSGDAVWHPEAEMTAQQLQQQTSALAQAERRNKAESEALQHRLSYLEWRQRGLVTRHNFRADDLRRNAKIFDYTSGSSHCSEACESKPSGYPQLHVRKDYSTPKLMSSSGFQTPEPIKEQSGQQRTLKWDSKCARTLAEPALDEQLFSMANMRRWRSQGGSGLGRQANHLHLPSLEAINEGAAVRSYRLSRRRAQFLATRARHCSGRLRLLELKERQAVADQADAASTTSEARLSKPYTASGIYFLAAFIARARRRCISSSGATRLCQQHFDTACCCCCAFDSVMLSQCSRASRKRRSLSPLAPSSSAESSTEPTACLLRRKSLTCTRLNRRAQCRSRSAGMAGKLNSSLNVAPFDVDRSVRLHQHQLNVGVGQVVLVQLSVGLFQRRFISAAPTQQHADFAWAAVCRQAALQPAAEHVLLIRRSVEQQVVDLISVAPILQIVPAPGQERRLLGHFVAVVNFELHRGLGEVGLGQLEAAGIVELRTGCASLHRRGDCLRLAQGSAGPVLAHNPDQNIRVERARYVSRQICAAFHKHGEFFSILVGEGQSAMAASWQSEPPSDEPSPKSALPPDENPFRHGQSTLLHSGVQTMHRSTRTTSDTHPAEMLAMKNGLEIHQYFGFDVVLPRDFVSIGDALPMADSVDPLMRLVDDDFKALVTMLFSWSSCSRCFPAIAVQFFLSKKSACFQTIMGSGSSVNSQAKSDTVDESAALQRLAKLVIQGDFGQVRQLAMRRLVKSKDGSGRTVLMLVADTRGTPLQAEKCILYLFELGADPKASDAEGNTAAHLAARRDHVRVLALLPFEAKWLQNERGRTPLMEAVLFGSWKCAKHLLHLLRQERFIDEYRGVSTARQLGRFLKASYTGDMSRNPMRQKFFGMKDQNGQTALELAKFKGYSELASYIEREMRLDVVAIGLINGLTKQEEADREKLECLAREGNVATLLRLVTRANCDLPSRAGHTMLMHLVRSVEIENASVWKQLLNLADPTCADINAKHLSEAGNDSAIVALLNAGAAANATKDNGETPLIAAASNTPIRRAFLTGWFLLAGGADWSLKDSRGCTAYEIALEYDKEDLTDLLQPSPERAEFPEVQPSTGSQSGATTRQTNWSEEEFYPVTNPQGFCIIINIGKYEELKHKEGGTAIIDPEIREGSAKDVQLVRQVFEELRFIVKVREDLKTQEIDRRLSQ